MVVSHFFILVVIFLRRWYTFFAQNAEKKFFRLMPLNMNRVNGAKKKSQKFQRNNRDHVLKISRSPRQCPTFSGIRGRAECMWSHEVRLFFCRFCDGVMTFFRSVLYDFMNIFRRFYGLVKIQVNF